MATTGHSDSERLATIIAAMVHGEANAHRGLSRGLILSYRVPDAGTPREQAYHAAGRRSQVEQGATA